MKYDEKIKFSIIIPVYNAEKYIETCIKSCVSQTLKEIEIILVNDGSTDNSTQICEKFLSRYSNIRYYKQQNLGLSKARNVGLNLANGEYIMFVDADDYIEKECLENIYCIMSKDKLEVTAFDCCIYDISGKLINKIVPLKIKNGEVIGGKDYINKYGYSVTTVVWAYAYSKEFINRLDLKFAEGLFHEDCEWTAHWFPYVKRLEYINCTFYNQVLSDNSIIRSKNIKKCNDLFEISKLIYQDALQVERNIDFQTAKELKKYSGSEMFAVIKCCVEMGYDIKSILNTEEKIITFLRLTSLNRKYFLFVILIRLRLYKLAEIFIKTYQITR